MKRHRQQSAGLLVFRRRSGKTEVLLAHPGGPLWRNKDAWTIPKGLVEAADDLLATARREFSEETGFVAEGPFVPLAPVKQRGGKVVYGFACEGDFDPRKLTSNLFEMEWPPHSGRRQRFPEVDRVAWFGSAEALEKIHVYQRPLLIELQERLAS
ncbi:MAG TPA: NUDIX domain-containing protein [Xanthobacteraceae bacterium]